MHVGPGLNWVRSITASEIFGDKQLERVHEISICCNSLNSIGSRGVSMNQFQNKWYIVCPWQYNYRSCLYQGSSNITFRFEQLCEETIQMLRSPVGIQRASRWDIDRYESSLMQKVLR